MLVLIISSAFSDPVTVFESDFSSTPTGAFEFIDTDNCMAIAGGIVNTTCQRQSDAIWYFPLNQTVRPPLLIKYKFIDGGAGNAWVGIGLSADNDTQVDSDNTNYILNTGTPDFLNFVGWFADDNRWQGYFTGNNSGVFEKDAHTNQDPASGTKYFHVGYDGTTIWSAMCSDADCSSVDSNYSTTSAYYSANYSNLFIGFDKHSGTAPQGADFDDITVIGEPIAPPPPPPADNNPSGNGSNNYTTRVSIINSDVAWQFNFSDDINLSTLVFGTNITGSWVNDSLVNISSSELTWYSYNVSKSIWPSMWIGNFCGAVWVSDSNSQTTTVESCYNVTEVFLPKTLEINLSLPNHQYNFENNLTVVNITLSEGSVKIGELTLNNYSLCYQESANVSTSCGGYGVGEYTFAGTGCNTDLDKYANATDGDYNTASITTSVFSCNVYIYLKIPENNLNNSVWQIKDDSSRLNITLPDYCYTYNSTHLKLGFTTGSGVINLGCFNSSDERTILSTRTSNLFYEESIYWQLGDNFNKIYVYNISNSSIKLNSTPDSVINIQNDNTKDFYDRNNHSFLAFDINNYGVDLFETVTSYYVFAYTRPYSINFTETSNYSMLTDSGDNIVDDNFPAFVLTNTNYSKVLACYNNTINLTVENSTWIYDSSKNIISVTYESAAGDFTNINWSHNQASSELYLNFTAQCSGNNTVSIEYDEVVPNIAITLPSIPIYYNSSFFPFNYSVTDSYSDLYRINLTLYHEGNGSFAKHGYLWDDLNVSTFSENRQINWSGLSNGYYFVEVCASDDIANSPVMPFYDVTFNKNLFGDKKDELRFTDENLDVDVTVFLEIVNKNDKKFKVKTDKLNVVKHKSNDDKHIVYGGKYPKDEFLKNGKEKDLSFRYRYHSNNNKVLKLVDEGIGLIHVDLGMQNIYYQHKDLLKKGWSIDSYYEGEDVVVQFWMDSYPDIIDFDPVSGGVNFDCVNSSRITKGYYLNISAVHAITAASINDFTIFMNSSLYNSNVSTTNGTVVFPVDNRTYQLTFNSSSYSARTVYLDITGDKNYTFSVIESGTIWLQFFDELTNASITENVTVEFVSDDYSNNFSTGNGSLVVNNLNASDYTIRAYANNYDERFRYVTLLDFDFQSVIFYLLPNSSADLVTVTVYDEITTPVQGARVKLYKYDLSTNSYILVEEQDSNYEGKVRLQMELGDEFYKFMVYYNDVLKKETAPAYYYSDTLSIYINLNEVVGTSFETTIGFNHNLEFQTSSNLFKLTYDDISDTADRVCLNVFTRVAGAKSLYNQTCTIIRDGIIYSGVQNISGRSYLAEVDVTYDDDVVKITELYYTFDTNAKDIFGTNGLFVLLLFTLTVIGLGAMLKSPIAVFLAPIPLIILSAVHIVQFSIYLAIGLEVAAIIFAALVRKNE